MKTNFRCSPTSSHLKLLYFKAFSDPFKPQTEEDLAIVRGILSALHENFKNQVKSARGEKLKGPESKLFSGQVWVGQDAVDIGLFHLQSFPLI